MMEALQGEAGSVDFEQSLKEMNMTPEEVMKKIMSDPELAVVSLQTCVRMSSSSSHADAQCVHICCIAVQQLYAMPVFGMHVCMDEDKKIISMMHFWSDLKRLSVLHHGHTFMLR